VVLGETSSTYDITTGTGSSTYDVNIGKSSNVYEITSGAGALNIDVSYGDRGPAGPAGPPGPGGVARNVEIYVKAGVAVSAGAAVYISGASGANKIIGLAQANTDSLSSKTLGLALQNLSINQFGYVVTEGDLSGLSIHLGSGHGIVEGDPIWLSPSTPGGLIFGLANKPSAPNHLVFLGIVTRINGNTLTDIFVKVQNGFELEELHDVAISNPVDNQVLFYDEGEGLWKNGFKASFVSNPDTGETLVLRDSESRIYAYQLRLTERTSQYAQINPPNFAPSDPSFSYGLPRANGTIALNTTAMMLTGTQTITGLKQFQGQVQLSNQAITSGDSALNADLADARYGAYTAISPGPVASVTTNFATIVSIVLPIGLYQIDAFLASSHASGFGCKIRLGTSHNIKVGLTDNYSRPSVAAFSWPLIDDAYNDAHPYAVRSDSGGVEYRRTITGIVEILTPGTTLRMDYAQLNQSTASPSTARTRAHILARKIN
jgi:hypothetical protein